jgi:hypothetical protein
VRRAHVAELSEAARAWAQEREGHENAAAAECDRWRSEHGRVAELLEEAEAKTEKWENTHKSQARWL